MGQANFWVMSIIGPAILLLVLIWLVMRRRTNRDDPANRQAEEGTRELYADEEQRRREGTDEL
jgi:hypothetical protein